MSRRVVPAGLLLVACAGAVLAADPAPAPAPRVAAEAAAPNPPLLHLNVSSALIARGGTVPLDRVVPIEASAGRSPVTGHAHLVGWQRTEVVPCTSGAVIRITIEADVATGVQLRRPLMRVFAAACSDVRVTQDIVITGYGISAGAPTVFAPTAIRVRAVETHLPVGNLLVRGGVRIGARVGRGAIDRTVTERVESQIETEVWGQLMKETADVNGMFANDLRPGLAASGVTPDQFRFSTSSSGLTATVDKPAPAPFRNAPRPDPAADARVVVHASLLNAGLEAKYGGRTLTNDEFAKPRTGPLSAFLTLKSGDKDSKPWSLKLPKKEPLTVAFRNDEIVIELHGGEFTIDGDVAPVMDVHARWAVERRAGGAVLVRKKPPEVYPPGFGPDSGKKIPVRFAPIRMLLTRQLDKLLPTEIDPARVLPVTPSTETGDRLSTTKLIATDDWLWLELKTAPGAKAAQE